MGLGGHNGGGNPLTHSDFLKNIFSSRKMRDMKCLTSKAGCRNKDLFSFHRQNKHCQPDRPDYCEGHHACPGC
jgi:hypothetical protein